MSTATRNVKNNLPSAQVLTINKKTQTAIFLHQPDPPFIALIVESSEDPSVREGDIFAVGGKFT
jgi:hypothetical protein